MTLLKRGERGLYRLWLQDEAPRIGSGNRIVEVHIGNRKAKLTCPFTKRTQRVPRAVLEVVLSNTIKQMGLRKMNLV